MAPRSSPGVWQSTAAPVKAGFAVVYFLLASFLTGMPGLRRPVFPLAVVLLSVCAPAADAPLVPYTVCEILHAPALYEGKAMAALGRYSYRQDGRWLSEQACQDTSALLPVIWLTEDTK